MHPLFTLSPDRTREDQEPTEAWQQPALPALFGEPDDLSTLPEQLASSALSSDESLLERLHRVGLLSAITESDSEPDDLDTLAELLRQECRERAIHPLDLTPFLDEFPSARQFLREIDSRYETMGERGLGLGDTVTRVALIWQEQERVYLCHQMRHFAGVFNEVLRILDDPRRYHSYYDEGELAYILLTTDQCAVIAGDDLLALLDDEESDLPALPASPIQMVTVAVPQRVRYSDWDGSREIAAAFPLGHSAVLTSRRWADYDGGLSLRWPLQGGVVLVLVAGHGDRDQANASAKLAFHSIANAVRADPFPKTSEARLRRLQAIFEAANEAFNRQVGLSASATVAVVTEGQLEVAYLGDCRVWHLSASRKNEQGLYQVTALSTDHTLMEDYRETLGAQATEEGLSALPYALTRGLGGIHAPSLRACELGDGDRILFTTARLHQQIPREELERLIRQAGPTPVYLVAALQQAVAKDDDGYACLAADIYRHSV